MNTTELKFSTVMLEDVKANEMVNSFIQAANDYLGAIGYTEHG